ncbi:Rrf2 family transcriptional regulator [Novosphingobium piscinae]|uniref:Rrf2 family transcriptional regulator n=1 Tax=Novosphingobium piscinae TaxID=1507448 RepID=A0A7X1FWR1_9SPHN|nr:Rrf2 family transcriptional regulator [Novosphingobium piscinae]MBC2668380.1 Rrf2 family transcriptional regulator [Novosphingobium piscinae]
MRLTRHTDYALRILLQAATQPGERLSIAAVAEAQGIARNHAMKLVNELANAGLLATTRGRGGGFTLGRAADSILIGEVVRLTEPDLQPADCPNCALQPACGLIPVLDGAAEAFLAELDRHTLADAARHTRLSPALRNRTATEAQVAAET